MPLLVAIAVAIGSLAGSIVLAQRPQIGLFLETFGACLLGFLRRQRAWVYTLVIGLSFALTSLTPLLASRAAPYPLRITLYLAALGFGLAWFGSYLGTITAGLIAPRRSPFDR